MINPITFVLLSVTGISIGSIIVYALKLLLIPKSRHEEEHSKHGMDFSDYQTRTIEDLD
jgi:hypothetical protein